MIRELGGKSPLQDAGKGKKKHLFLNSVQCSRLITKQKLVEQYIFK